MASITETDFGTYKNNPIRKYTLKSGNLEIDVLNWGATISAIRCPDKDGKIADIALGYDTFEEYLAKNNPYFGAVVGRVANRIGGAKFQLNGREIKVSANRPPNHLHGGFVGFDKVIWKSQIRENRVIFSYLSKDLEEGYPGNITVSAEYSLSPTGELKLEMKAFTDQPTPVNLTNHTYFNLAGHNEGKTAIYDHIISVNADKYTATDDASIPTGELIPVGGTLWDLRIPRRFGDLISLVPGGGFDQNLCVTMTGELNFVARVVHPGSNRCLEVYSNQPGVQLYTANYFPKVGAGEEPLVGKGRNSYYQHGAFCLETQNFPDAVNHTEFPPSILHPGDLYHHIVVYKFSVFN